MKKVFLFLFICIVAMGSIVGWLIYTKKSSILSPIVSVGSRVISRPLDAYTIEALSKRAYIPSPIVFDQATATTSAYTVYTFHFMSDGKKVTGLAHVPIGASATNPRPVILQYRGYMDKDIYKPGDETKHSAEVFAKNGFISLAPDFLGYGGSQGPSQDVFEERFETYTTALNLYASVPTLPIARQGSIGIWGHSNGGHIAITVLEVLHKAVPASLWAPVTKPFPYSILYYTDEADDHGKSLRLVLARFEQLYDVEKYSLTNYVDRLVGPLQIHQGGADDAVPQKWSDQFVHLLKEKGYDVSYFVYPQADHNMLPDAWNTVVVRDVAFFKKWLEVNKGL